MSNSASSKVPASLNPHTEKSCPQIFSPAFFSLSSTIIFKNYFYSIFPFPFFLFCEEASLSSVGAEAAGAAAALQTCLQPESRMEKELTSGILNQILPRETSRNHTLLCTHIHSLPLLSLLFPWVLWQRTPRFSECTFPAALAGKKCLKCCCAHGNSYTPGNPSQGGLERGGKGKIKKKKARRKKEIYKYIKER